MIPYKSPIDWISYQLTPPLLNALVEAKAAINSLTTIPYQKNWADELQIVQLKREVAGTSRIEGADFTENELNSAMSEEPDALLTRSQRQAAAATRTYKWIAELEDDRPMSEELIREIHSLIISGADDDHCGPGQLRKAGENVTFGSPRHRGCEGGEKCGRAFGELCNAIRSEFRGHDPLVQALAAHYHIAAMHPFLDGNGRTARAVEALFLQRTGLRDSLFIAMSNYYYDEKTEYLEVLSQVRADNHDLTSFLVFGLQGVALQCQRLFEEIKKNLSKVLFRNMMYELFNRLLTGRKRVMGKRQIEILKVLLDEDRYFADLAERTRHAYRNLGHPEKAFFSDLNALIGLQAIGFKKDEKRLYRFWVRLEWPTEITETQFFEAIKQLPKAKTHSFLG